MSHRIELTEFDEIWCFGEEHGVVPSHQILSQSVRIKPEALVMCAHAVFLHDLARNGAISADQNKI